MHPKFPQSPQTSHTTQGEGDADSSYAWVPASAPQPPLHSTPSWTGAWGGREALSQSRTAPVGVRRPGMSRCAVGEPRSRGPPASLMLEMAARRAHRRQEFTAVLPQPRYLIPSPGSTGTASPAPAVPVPHPQPWQHRDRIPRFAPVPLAVRQRSLAAPRLPCPVLPLRSGGRGGRSGRRSVPGRGGSLRAAASPSKQRAPLFSAPVPVLGSVPIEVGAARDKPQTRTPGRGPGFKPGGESAARDQWPGPVHPGTAGPRNRDCPGAKAPAGMGGGHPRGWAGGLERQQRGT